MPKMECNGRQAGGTKVNLFVCQTPTVTDKVFFCGLKSVEDGSLHGRGFGQGAAQPRLGLFGFSHGDSKDYTEAGTKNRREPGAPGSRGCLALTWGSPQKNKPRH